MAVTQKIIRKNTKSKTQSFSAYLRQCLHGGNINRFDGRLVNHSGATVSVLIDQLQQREHGNVRLARSRRGTHLNRRGIKFSRINRVSVRHSNMVAWYFPNRIRFTNTATENNNSDTKRRQILTIQCTHQHVFKRLISCGEHSALNGVQCFRA